MSPDQTGFGRSLKATQKQMRLTSGRSALDTLPASTDRGHRTIGRLPLD